MHMLPSCMNFCDCHFCITYQAIRDTIARIGISSFIVEKEREKKLSLSLCCLQGVVLFCMSECCENCLSLWQSLLYRDSNEQGGLKIGPATVAKVFCTLPRKKCICPSGSSVCDFHVCQNYMSTVFFLMLWCFIKTSCFTLNTYHACCSLYAFI